MPASLIVSSSINIRAKTLWSRFSWKLSYAHFGECSDGSWNILAIFQKHCYYPPTKDNITALPSGSAQTVIDPILNGGITSLVDAALVLPTHILFSLERVFSQFRVLQYSQP